MIGSIVQRYVNIPVIALFVVLVASASAAISMTAGSATAGASAYGPYPFQPYPAHFLSARNDRCYSSINTYANNFKMFGVTDMNFGLVNAVVNLPIYDWDQDTLPDTTQGYRYGLYQVNGSTGGVADGLRGSVEGRSVGYAESFSFNVSAIPNAHWISQYLTKQLPYDISLVTGAGMGSKGTRGDPLIANPFLYSQGAIIRDNGWPAMPVLSGPLAGSAPSDGLPEIGDVTGSLVDAIGHNSAQQRAEREANREIHNNRDAIRGTINGLRDGHASVNGFIAGLLSTPILKDLLSMGYSVNAHNTGQRTLCYEDLDGSNNNIVPAYAFSVPGAGIPVTVPGWIYSVLTAIISVAENPLNIFTGGVEFSASGFTFYTGGSLNGKDMLDCFGRGVQPTIYGHNSLRVSQAWTSPFRFGTLFFLNPLYWANLGIYTALAATGAEPVARALPAIIMAYEDYTTGFAFLFDINNNVTTNNARLPGHLSKRAVYPAKSKLRDINLRYALGFPGGGHGDSQNSQQFNPDVYLKLYSPFVLDVNFDMSGDQRETPDGTEVAVKINATKHGFKDQNRSDGGYKEDTNVTGGPTYNPNLPAGSDRSFTEARVYKMVMKPGTVVNAIDASKVQGGTEVYYRSDTDVAVNASTDPCEFFANQLRVGDTGANPSALTPGTSSNANNDLPDAPAIDNRPLTDDANFTCGEIASKKLEMQSSDTGSGSDTDGELYNATEKIPSETPPGTKFCYAVYYTDYTNDLKTIGKHWWNPAANHPNWNPDHNTPEDKTFLTRANCIISGYKPSFQVRGGDLIVDGKVDTGLNQKEFLASTDDPKELRTYGSWAEYGVIAKGRVSNIGSGALHRTGMPEGWNDVGYLTFSNNVAPDGNKEYGEYAEYADPLDDGFTRVARQFTSMSNAAVEKTGPVLNLADPDLESGVYELVGNTTIVSRAPEPDGSPVELEEGKSIILLARDGSRHTIADNITIPDKYDSISKISQVVIAPAEPGANFRINIAENVKNVDAWLITPDGSINTCHTVDPISTPRALTLCEKNPLQVNGPVAAKHLILRRSGGHDQSVVPNVVHQSVPGESFNLRPDAYIWAAQYVNDGGRKYITTHSMDLPPRY